MDPKIFRQSSPITRLGGRAIAGVQFFHKAAEGQLDLPGLEPRKPISSGKQSELPGFMKHPSGPALPASKPLPKSEYGKPSPQASKAPHIPGVAAHQEAMTSPSGAQLTMQHPGVHTPSGKSPKPKMPQTIGKYEVQQAKLRSSQAESQRQAYGGSMPQAGKAPYFSAVAQHAQAMSSKPGEQIEIGHPEFQKQTGREASLQMPQTIGQYEAQQKKAPEDPKLQVGEETRFSGIPIIGEKKPKTAPSLIIPGRKGTSGSLISSPYPSVAPSGSLVSPFGTPVSSRITEGPGAAKPTPKLHFPTEPTKPAAEPLVVPESMGGGSRPATWRKPIGVLSHGKMFGPQSKTAARKQKLSELSQAASAKPLSEEGAQGLLPGIRESNIAARREAKQKLEQLQSEVGREKVGRGKQLTFGETLTKPQSQLQQLGTAMRSGAGPERTAAMKQQAAALGARREQRGGIPAAGEVPPAAQGARPPSGGPPPPPEGSSGPSSEASRSGGKKPEARVARGPNILGAFGTGYQIGLQNDPAATVSLLGHRAAGWAQGALSPPSPHEQARMQREAYQQRAEMLRQNVQQSQSAMQRSMSASARLDIPPVRSGLRRN